MPSKKPKTTSNKAYRMIYCQCHSRKCGEIQYIDSDGQRRYGNKIFQHLARTHQLEDERHRVTSRDDLAEERANTPEYPNAGIAGPLNTLIENLRLSSAGMSRDNTQSSNCLSISQMDSPLYHTEMAVQSDHSCPSTSRNHKAETDQLDPSIPIYDTSTLF